MKENKYSNKEIVHFSGGKDSTAMLLRMIELGMKIDEIGFCDTGLEYTEQYEYIKKIEKHIGIKINYIRPDTTFFKWFYGKWTRGKMEGEIRGFPFVLTHGYCCRELKVKPSNKLYKEQGNHYLGIAYDERHRCSTLKNYKYPLVDWKWTEDKCAWYLKEKGLENPLYKRQNRTGCWLCPKQSKESLHQLFDNHRNKWNALKRLEKISPHGFHPNFKLIELENKWKYQTKLNT